MYFSGAVSEPSDGFKESRPCPEENQIQDIETGHQQKEADHLAGYVRETEINRMIVCGLHLSSEERSSLIAQCSGFQIADISAPGLLARGDVCLPDLPETSVLDLPAWGLPVLVWAGAPAAVLETKQRLFAAGLSALWIPSLQGQDFGPILNPPALPSRGRACLLIPDRNQATLFRQIFLFAGMESRSDFHSAEDFAFVLPVLREETDTDLHVVIDLNQADFLPALHALGKVSPSSASLHVWALRDFSRPGPDPSLVQRYLSPFTSRIFEPLEAIVALIEALFLFDSNLDRFRAKADPLQTFDGFRNAERLLRGRSVQLLQPDPRAMWSATLDLLQRQRRALPFHWLIDLYSDHSRGGGVVLARHAKDGES